MTPEQVKELVERLRSRKRVVAIGEDKHDAAKYTAQMAEDDGAAISALSLLAQEREELRGALKTIARGTSKIFDRNPQTMSFNEAQSIARAALASNFHLARSVHSKLKGVDPTQGERG